MITDRYATQADRRRRARDQAQAAGLATVVFGVIWLAYLFIRVAHSESVAVVPVIIEMGIASASIALGIGTWRGRRWCAITSAGLLAALVLLALAAGATLLVLIIVPLIPLVLNWLAVSAMADTSRQ